MRRIPRLAPLLAVFWLALSGHFEARLLALGALSVALVLWVVHRMDVIDHESLPAHVSPSLPRYCLWLAGKVLRSSLAVTRQVWSPRSGLRPTLDLTPARELPELSQAIYANSVTLTPGTLALTVNDDSIEVHSLQESDIAELHAGEMLGRVRRLEAR